MNVSLFTVKRLTNRQRLDKKASCTKENLSRPTCEKVFTPLFECGAHLFEHGCYVCLVVFFVVKNKIEIFVPFVNKNDFFS